MTDLATRVRVRAARLLALSEDSVSGSVVPWVVVAVAGFAATLCVAVLWGAA